MKKQLTLTLALVAAIAATTASAAVMINGPIGTDTNTGTQTLSLQAGDDSYLVVLMAGEANGTLDSGAATYTPSLGGSTVTINEIFLGIENQGPTGNDAFVSYFAVSLGKLATGFDIDINVSDVPGNNNAGWTAFQVSNAEAIADWEILTDEALNDSGSNNSLSTSFTGLDSGSLLFAGIGTRATSSSTSTNGSESSGSSIPNVSGGGFAWAYTSGVSGDQTISYTDNNFTADEMFMATLGIESVVIPEPSTFALMALVGFAAVILRRRIR